MSLATRQLVPELMDDPAIDADEHRRALRGLARLTRLSRSAHVIRNALVDLAPPPGAAPLRVLDVATGGGDVPRRLATLAPGLRIDGCDCSPTAVDLAATQPGGTADARVFELDVLEDPLPAGYDVIVCSLFLHHLPTETAVDLVRRLAAAAGRRLVVNDLERGRLNLCLVAIGARLVTRSPVVHTDAARSVRAAFTADELRAIARRAGLQEAVVERRAPCRLLLRWDRR